jgi:hypothetical protein
MNDLGKKRVKWNFVYFLLLVTLVNSVAEKLQVYSTSTIPVKVREKALKKDSSLKAIDITVFGKFNEFASSLKSSKPKFLITPAQFPHYHPDYKAVYQFTKNDEATFKFLVLSLQDKKSLKDIATASVGIVDELGRKNTSSFVKKNIGDFKRIKRVTKTDDLMPLLVLENADFIIIRPENYNSIKAKFTTQTYLAGESKEIHYPVICVLKDTSETEIKKIGKISPMTIKSLGFDQIRELK